MTFEDILRVFSGRPPESKPDLRLALMPLVGIADKFDANQLAGLAQRVGCCGPNTLPPECMILVQDCLGRPLLTVADCLAARSAIGGTLDFKDFPVEQSQ